MSKNDSGYTGIVLQLIDEAEADIGDTITITKEKSKVTGILMPRSQVGSDAHHIIIKLPNGYNIGVRITDNDILTKEKGKKRSKKPKPPSMEHIKEQLPTVSILSTGGTIASRVDYRTGAVNPALTAQDLYDSVPELQDHANIRAKVLMSVLSENILPDDWEKIARAIAKEIRSGVDGVVIAHGTDTMAFTASALSFALQNLPVPVVLVGSQRSSDRPSSDAALNLVGSIDFVGTVNAAEVMVVMHGVSDDSFLLAHRASRTRKLHTSRRDAFQSVNATPLYKIEEKTVDELDSPLRKRDRGRKLKIRARFDGSVALVKTYPGMSEGIITHLVDEGYKGLVVEGSGLGHVPKQLYPEIKRAIENDLVVTMTSQCINGRVDMNVYRSGVELLEMGVISGHDMLAEVALVKMMWLLANEKTTAQIRTKMQESLVGEIDMRSEPSEYVGNRELV